MLTWALKTYFKGKVLDFISHHLQYPDNHAFASQRDCQGEGEVEGREKLGDKEDRLIIEHALALFKFHLCSGNQKLPVNTHHSSRP